MPNYRNAFKCHKCPERADEQGCPAWVDGMIETNIETGEERITKGCLFALLPRILIEVVKASNRPASVLESWRNEHLEKITLLTHRLASSGVIDRGHKLG